MSRLLIFISVAMGILPAVGLAQQEVFTNKQGVQIVAEIVSVNPDWKLMTIRKEGSSFDISPNVLSLDDQQKIKEWLKQRGITGPNQTAPVAPSDDGASAPAPVATPSIDLDKVSLDIKITKKQVDSKRGRNGDYMKLETRFYVFDLVVKNRSRETIPAPKISYAAVWLEKVAISGDEYVSDSNDFEYAIKGEKELAQLTYNRDETVTTDRIEINEVIYDGNSDYLEDKLIGVVVRVTLADGTMIGQFRGNGAETAGLTWEKVSKLPSKPGEERPMMDDSDDDSQSYVRLQKGQSQDGPIKLAGKKIAISAKVTPDTKSPNGVVAAIGGDRVGLSLYVKDRKIFASVNSSEGIKWVSKPLPLGSFVAQVDLNSSGLSLSIDGGTAANRPDVPLFKEVSLEGIDAGNDTGTQAGDYPKGFIFEGAIENLRVLIKE